MKQMTKKELEAFIENKWGEICNKYGCDDPRFNKVTYVYPLCKNMPKNSGWNKYWEEINTKTKAYIHGYFNHASTAEETLILRLITLHLFVRHKFPERKKKRGVKR